ncbi:MAG: hypothetical protein ACI4XR_00090 [Bacilli bacterium]
MNIINPKSGNLETIIQSIDDSIIMELVHLALQCKKDTERYNLRDKIYNSKYRANNLEGKELALESFLQQMENANIRTENQNKEYKWVKINTNNMGDISYRFYIAPNPENMHEIVKKLVDTFSIQNVPVRFKYQLTSGMEQCDRIIIYSDFNNIKLVEQSIKSVYQSSPQLFKGCERSIAWLYNSEVPGVYFAPETPGDAYSNRLTDVILEAKETFNFLYGITNSNRNITLSGKDVDQAIDYMKMLIGSIMLRKGVLLSKDGKCITIKDKKVKVNYNYDTGILEHSNTDSRGFYSVKFYPTLEGRKALLENFYSVSKIQQQIGLEVKYLTLEQRREEIDRVLYPHKYNNFPPTTNVEQNGRRIK